MTSTGGRERDQGFRVVEEPRLRAGEWFLIGSTVRLAEAVRLVQMLDRVYGPAWQCEGMGV